MKQQDRLDMLLGVFKEHRTGCSKTRLAEETGIALGNLNEGRPTRRTDTTIERIGAAAGKLLQLDQAQLIAWLKGEAEPSIQAWLEIAQKQRRCVGCLNFFEEEDIIAAQGRCRGCVRDRGFAQRLNRRPDLKAFYERVDQVSATSEAQEADPELIEIVRRKRAEGRAIKLTEIAGELKTTRAVIAKRWRALIRKRRERRSRSSANRAKRARPRPPARPAQRATAPRARRHARGCRSCGVPARVQCAAPTRRRGSAHEHV